MWIFYVIIYALLKGTRECMKKSALKISGANEILFYYTLIGFILTLPSLKSAVGINLSYIFCIFIKSSVCCAAWGFSLYALKKIPVGVYSVTELSGVIFSTLFGVMILGENFSIYNGIGLLLVITGLLLVNIKNKSFSGNKNILAIAAVLMSCFFNSVSGLLDKVLSAHIAPPQLQFWFMLFTAMIYGAVFIYKKEKFHFTTLKQNLWIPLMSISLIFGDLLLFRANASPESEVTVMTLIKQLSVVTSVTFGGIFFKEKNIMYKLFCAAIIITGIAIPLLIK